MLCVHLYVIYFHWQIGCWEVTLRKSTGFVELSCKLCATLHVHKFPLPFQPVWALSFCCFSPGGGVCVMHICKYDYTGLLMPYECSRWWLRTCSCSHQLSLQLLASFVLYYWLLYDWLLYDWLLCNRSYLLAMLQLVVPSPSLQWTGKCCCFYLVILLWLCQVLVGGSHWQLNLSIVLSCLGFLLLYLLLFYYSLSPIGQHKCPIDLFWHYPLYLTLVQSGSYQMTRPWY